jgi:hypothetical protein
MNKNILKNNVTLTYKESIMKKDGEISNIK